LYSMFGTPTSLMTGTSLSFFDGAEKETIRRSYQGCARLRGSIEATAKLKQIRQWESQRPDTFN
jgi:hypothetical protein